ALLQKAAAFHREKIEASIGLAGEEANRFSGTVAKLREQRNFALDFTLADIEKESGALIDLRRAHGDAALWLKEANAQHGRAAASMGVVNSSATAIDEIRRELAYCAGGVVAISQRTFNRVLSKHSSMASNLHDRLGELSAFHQDGQRYRKAREHNGTQTWASTEMRAFADIVNEWRHVLGLPALRLEKRLSVACAAHSTEMIEMGYFAHRSPVEGNSTPGQRASNADYKGTFVGENIYFYSSPQGARAAFDAWWQSDGHRFVMFDPRSDELGLSNRPGTHWTMMTGTAPVRTEVKAARVE
ncbi:MAG: CAP domain-containing protein, partial [Verrucomicrobiales bacterium]